MHRPIASTQEPLAIVGIGCRLPGDLAGPGAFWQALCDELDVVGEVPAERWDVDVYHHPDRDRAGTTYTRSAAMLSDIDQFDAAFFRIAPQEASRIDPQHRLLLEVTWEALEDAGQPAAALAGRKVGVFMGQSFQDYLALQLRDPRSENAYTMMGGASCMAANRLSYFLDLRGPSVTLDTACASGLTSLHAACQSLWTGESVMALAGGVNVSLVPGGFVGFSRAQMLSPTGRCQAFSANADGYVRGEGAGVVVIKPLSAALEAGDRIYAVVRATGINHHGHSQGITFPGVEAQEELLRTVTDRAGVAPHDIQYVEAHGTGTQAGDPVEATAIGRALGQGRTADAPLRLGSAKTNVGHAEAAAGIVGLIKLSLALKHRYIPRNLHADKTNPSIPFAELGLRVATTAERWPATVGQARGMVSAFGFGGANACALLEEAPMSMPARVPDGQGPFLLPLSARSDEAVRALVLGWLGRLRESPAPETADLCHTAALRRDHHDHRLALAFHDTEDLSALLGAWLRGDTSARVVTDRARGRAPKIAFAFCGNGPQWWAMGRQLLEREPIFRAVVERCAKAFAAISDYDLFLELGRSEETTRMSRTDVAQPAIYALQIGLCELLASWGIRPDAVVGHSAGEGASAYIAGALDFDDAIQVIYHRCRTQQMTEGSGRLAAAGLSIEDAEKLVRRYDGRVCVSAHNSARQVTFSGELATLRALGEDVQATGAFWREIPMDYAFHSRAMDVVRDDLCRSLEGITPQRPSVPFYSTVTGCLEPEALLDVDYWWRNLRQPVLFAPAAEALIRDGYDIVLEIGPHPALRTYLSETASTLGSSMQVLPTLRRKEDERERLLSTIGALYAAGCPVDFSRYRCGALVDLPTYPWQRERHWNEPSEASQVGGGRIVHPLLGRRVEAHRPEWRVEIDLDVQTWVRDHGVGGSVVFPGAGYLEQSLAVARELLGEGPVAVERVEIEKALVLEEKVPVKVRVTFDPAVGSFEVRSGEDGATVHARGEVSRVPSSPPESLDVTGIQERCLEHLDQAGINQEFERRGLFYGPAFQGVQEIWRREGEALALVTLPPVLSQEGGAGRVYRWHPAVLDACLQAMIAALPAGTLGYLPVALRQLVVYGQIPVRLFSHVRLSLTGGGSLSCDLTVAGPDGRVVARIKEIIGRPIDLVGQRTGDLVHTLVWEPKPHMLEAAAGRDSAEVLAASGANRPGHATQQLEAYRDRTLARENALCSVYVATALTRLGWQPRDGEQFTTSSLAAQLGIAERHHRQLGRMLEFLAEDGLLRADPEKQNEWTVLEPLPDGDLTGQFQALWASCPASHAQIELTHRVGLCLDQILRGEIDPLSLIFSETSAAGMEEIYDASPVQWYGNSTTRAILQRILDGQPPGHGLEVLEVGAGTGGLTAWLLPVLEADRDRYRFTDVSDAFLPAARARFGEFRFVDYDTMNVESLEDRHRVAPADLVVASNVLHATRDVRETLSNIRSLVRPGGCAVFVELSPGIRAIELVYGLLPGWWRLQDEQQLAAGPHPTGLRSTGPLLRPEAWKALASECGFDEVALATDEEAGTVMSVVVARVACAQSAERKSKAAASGTWLVLADDGGLGEQVALELKQAGARCVRALRGESFENATADAYRVRTGRIEDLSRVLGDIVRAGEVLQGVVNLWALDAASSDHASLAAVEEQGCLTTAHLLRTFAEGYWRESPRLWLATRGARAVLPGECPAFVQAPLWGLGRSAMLEHSELRCTLIDLDPARDPHEARRLVAELLAPAESVLEQAIALRGHGRFVERLAQTPAEEEPIEATADMAFRLEATRPGVLSRLELVEVERQAPGAGEVELEVHASALNFRDVMLALDILPSRESPPQPGMECSGVITAVGEGVTTFRPGDEVMAISNGTFARYVLAKATALLRKPKGMSHVEAATIPASFATAVYALDHLGRMRAGDRLLVHGAAGALGLAAIQLALQAGVEVYATAGTPEKRELLRELGAKLVMDSRSLEFAGQILAATQGEGVDLVLNSLSGDALVKSLEVLKPLGRFLEVGKRDFFANSRLGWRLLQQRSYHAIDLDKVVAMASRPCREIMEDLQRRLDDGVIRPLPHRVFPLSRAAEAFKTMQRSRHVGKLVVETREPRVPVHRAPRAAAIQRNGTYLVTGGLGGLGLAMGDWLAREGAGRVVLLGRSDPTPEQRRAIGVIEQAGATVTVERGDVSDNRVLERVLEAIRRDGPPLRGIFHGAMVLDDALLMNLTPERIEKVMAPKAHAALRLHEQTLEDPLDFFVCCSSLAGILGNAGQAIYGAANTFLDALCEHRRARGLPALSVSFGAIADVGFVARTEGLTAALEARGMLAFPVRDGLQVLSQLMRTSRAHVGLFRYDWSRYSAGGSALVTNLIEPAVDVGPGSVEVKDDLRERLRTVSDEERRALLREKLSWHISRIVGVNGDRIDLDTPIAAMGMDSLMAVDLHRYIETSFSADVPVMSILKGWSIADLAREVDRRLGLDGTGSNPSRPDAARVN